MRVVLLLLAFVFAPSCASNNPCSADAPVCISLRVEGSVGALDALAVTVDQPNLITRNTSGKIALPLLLGLNLPAGVSGAVNVAIDGRLGGEVSARGTATAFVVDGRGSATLLLDATRPDLAPSIDRVSDLSVAQTTDIASDTDFAPTDLAMAVDQTAIDQSALLDQNALLDLTEQTIMEIVAADPQLSQLKGALVEADLAGALSGDGPLTLFAPTDSAFAELGTSPTGQALKDLLLYHLLPVNLGSTEATAVAANAAPNNRVSTLLSSKFITLSFTGGKLHATSAVNSATLIQVDIQARNGVIHIIDKVLVPN